MKSRVFKIILISFLGLIAVLLAGLILIPLFFKKEIQGYVQQEIDKNIKGKIMFADFSVSCLRDFPNASLTFDNFLVTGSGEFEKDSIVSTKELRIAVDLVDLFQKKDLDIKMLLFKQPDFRFTINKNGLANYDLMKQDSSGTDTSTLALKSLVIEEGKLTYSDFSKNIFIHSKNMKIKGEAKLLNNVFDLVCTSELKKFSYGMNGLQVLKDKDLSGEFNIDLDLNKNKITFKKNSARINDFEFILDGSLGWSDSTYNYDLKFNTGRDDLKDLISLFPGIYPEDMKNFFSDGSVMVSGWVKGEMKNSLLPAFHVNFKIKDGQLKYNSLPEKIHNIQFDLVLNNKGGPWENTSINLNKFHFDLGKNPFRGYLKINDLKSFVTSAEIKSKIDLAHLNEIFPIENFEFRGIFNSDIKVNGSFDVQNNKFPEMDANISLIDGYAKANEYSVELDKIHLDALINNPSGDWDETSIQLDTFAYEMDGQPFVVKGLISNLKNYDFDLFIKGKFNLEKISSFFAMENMVLKGEADTDIEATGDIRNFNNLSVNGKLELDKFFFSSLNLPDGLYLDNGKLTLDKEKIFMDNVNGKFAGSEFKIHGHLFDYLSYFYNTNTTLRGDMLFECDSFNVSDWLNSYKENLSSDNSSEYSSFRIPEGIDFVFDSDIRHLKFEDMIVNNLKGEISFHEGKMSVKETGFNTIGSKISLNGHYNTKPENFEFDFELEINDLDIHKAYQSFSFVRNMAPAAEHTFGLISIQYKLKGNHNEKYDLDYSSLEGSGVISIAEAKVNNMKLFSHLGHVSKKEKLKNPVLNSIVMETSVKDGRVIINPFIFKLAALDTELQGYTDFKGEMKFLCKIEFLKDKIKIPFHIEGKYDDPIVKVGKGHEDKIIALENEGDI